jgi:hypothetical protein
VPPPASGVPLPESMALAPDPDPLEPPLELDDAGPIPESPAALPDPEPDELDPPELPEPEAPESEPLPESAVPHSEGGLLLHPDPNPSANAVTKTPPMRVVVMRASE